MLPPQNHIRIRGSGSQPISPKGKQIPSALTEAGVKMPELAEF
jgi:hypothetical protein